MNIDIHTLVIVIGLIHLMQFLVFFHQYKVNKSFKGPGWWLAWSAAEVIGFGAMLLRNIPSLLPLVIIIQNSMIVAGTVFLYIGVRQFLNKPVNLKLILPLVSSFLAGLLYFLFIDNEIQIRSAIISATLAIISFFTAESLFVSKIRSIRATAHFNALIFFAHGFIFVYHTVIVLTNAHVEDVFIFSLFNLIPYFDALIVSLMWTFGLIIMLNQRLNAGMSEAIEDQKLIYNTSPDGAIITRLEDAQIVDINEGYTNDITSRKKEERALKESEHAKSMLLAKLNEAQKIAMIGSWEWDLKTNKVWWSDECYRIFGVSPEEFTPGFEANGKFIHPDDLEKYEKTFEHSFKTGNPLDSNFRLVIPDGSIKYIQAKGKLLYDDAGYAILFFGTVMDITSFKLAEEKILKTNRVYTVISQINKAIVHLRNRDDLFKEVCRIAVESGKFQMAWVGLVDEQTQNLLPVAFAGVEDGYRSSIALPIKIFSNNIGAFTLYSDTPHFFDPEEIAILDEVTSDIGFALEVFETEEKRKQAEAEIIHLNETLELRVAQRTAQLEASNQELEAFTHSVSHDLRAPLRHISGYVDLLAQRCHSSLTEQGIHYLDTITDAAYQMGALIDDLLQFSRTGRQEMRETDVDMNNLLQEVVESMKDDYSGRNIEWVIARLPHVIADQSLMRLVWVNLLSNAVKFTRPRKTARIEIGCINEKKEVVFFVRDNGAGFDMQYAHKLFGVFQRMHATEEFEGTGIGLANVRRILLRHGGRTWADAIQDEGATFYFSLPDKKEDNP